MFSPSQLATIERVDVVAKYVAALKPQRAKRQENERYRKHPDRLTPRGRRTCIGCDAGSGHPRPRQADPVSHGPGAFAFRCETVTLLSRQARVAFLIAMITPLQCDHNSKTQLMRT